MIAYLPIAINTTALRVTTNAADAAAWAAGTTYALEATVTYGQREYTSLQAGNIGKTPDAEPLWWFDAGPANSWAMFDDSVQTATTRADGLSVTIAPGRVNSLALLGMTGASVTVTVRDGSGGPVIYSRTETLETTNGTYYGWFFEPWVARRDLFLTDLPATPAAHITIAVSGATAAIGLCAAGRAVDIGIAQRGFALQIEDRGRQWVDALGNPQSLDRGYSKRASGVVLVPRGGYNRTVDWLASIVGQNCVWVAAPGTRDLTSAIVYGRFSRAAVLADSPVSTTLQIEISGTR